MANLKQSSIRRVSDTSLCISRKKYGRGFQYFDENGEKVEDSHLLKRLRSLIIPPMWSEVHVCKWHDGHIQATGRDAKGRKQYIYHSEWEILRQEEKFSRMKDFGSQLPKLRQQLIRDLQKKDGQSQN